MADKKFDQFVDGGETKVGDIIVGLRSSDLTKNFKFDFPGTGIKDSNGNYLLRYSSVGASAINYPQLINSISNTEVIFTADGSDSDIDISIQPKVNGQLILDELRWPTSDGTPNSFIITDGSGNLGFTTGSIIISWTEVTSTTQTITPNNGYIANNSGLVTFTLPITSSLGTIINIIGKGSGGWQVNQNSGQNIQVGSSSSSIGVSGNISSTNRFDSIQLVCTTDNITWTVLGAPQSSGITII